MGIGRLTYFHLSLAADACSRGGNHSDALAHIAKAFEVLESSDDVAFSAELHRTRAAVLLRADRSKRYAAETDLKRALEIARAQEALSPQLRAARDLAQLWAAHGERRQAADLLAPIYAAFTEGSDTLDLQEAKILLSDLQ